MKKREQSREGTGLIGRKTRAESVVLDSSGGITTGTGQKKRQAELPARLIFNNHTFRKWDYMPYTWPKSVIPFSTFSPSSVERSAH